NNDTTSATFLSLATRANRSVVGLGTASAKLNSAASSVRQKYSPANSSCRQIICAPRAAASRIFSSFSPVHRICTSPTANLSAIVPSLSLNSPAIPISLPSVAQTLLSVLLGSSLTPKLFYSCTIELLTFNSLTSVPPGAPGTYCVPGSWVPLAFGGTGIPACALGFLFLCDLCVLSSVHSVLPSLFLFFCPPMNCTFLLSQFVLSILLALEF